MTVRLKSGEVVAWSPVDDGPVQQDVPEDGGSISAQLSLSTPGSMVTEAMTMTYDQTEATLSRIRTQLDHAVSGDAVAAITSLADTLPAALPDDPETVGHVADGQTALAGAMAALRRAVDAAQAALKSHELNNGPAHDAAQSAGGAPEREYVTDGLAGQIELAFNPAEPRGKGGEWVTLFHGTVESNIEGIRSKGLTPAKGNIGIASVAHTLTDTREHAENYSRKRAAGWLTPKVVEFHVPRKDAGKYLYPGDAYDAEGKATGYALRKPLPSKYIHAVHDVGGGSSSLDFSDGHLLTTDLAAWEHEARGKGGEWTYDTNIVGRVTATSPAGKTHTIYTRGLGLTKLRHPDDMPAPLYHGTRAQLKPGDQIEAGHPGNFVRSMDNVYLTEQPESSDSYKGARGYGQHVYEVRPTGWYGHRRDAKGAEWATGDPVTVVREVPNPRATIQS